MRLPKGYTLLVINRDRQIVKEIDIGEYDLDKQIARGDVMNQIQEAAEKEAESDKRNV